MYYVYSTYREYGLGTISQFTGYEKLVDAENFVRDFCEQQANKHPEWKIVRGEIVGESC